MVPACGRMVSALGGDRMRPVWDGGEDRGKQGGWEALKCEEIWLKCFKMMEE